MVGQIVVALVVSNLAIKVYDSHLDPINETLAMFSTNTENFAIGTTMITDVVKRVGMMHVLTQRQDNTSATNAATTVVVVATITVAGHARVRRNETT